LSAGEDIEKAHRLAAQACGLLVTLIVKRKGNREYLEAALRRLEEASGTIRSLLTDHTPGGRVRVPTERAGDQD